MKYTFQFGDGARGDKHVLKTRSSESLRHITLKALGCVLYHARRPQIETPVSDDKRDYKPDIVAFDAAGAIALWVDCGQIALRKVDDLARARPETESVVIKPTRREMEMYARGDAKNAPARPGARSRAVSGLRRRVRSGSGRLSGPCQYGALGFVRTGGSP